MPYFIVDESDSKICKYLVEADSKEQAQEKVEHYDEESIKYLGSCDVEGVTVVVDIHGPFDSTESALADDGANVQWGY